MKESTEKIVTVRFLGAFWSVTGTGEHKVAVTPGTTLKELFIKLGEKYGAPFNELMWGSDGKFRPQCKVLLGSKDISSDDMHTKVNGEVYLIFVTALAGG